MTKYPLKYINDDLFEILRVLKTIDMIVPKRNPNMIDKELLGLWVHHVGGERVVREGDKLLIVRKIEDAKYL